MPYKDPEKARRYQREYQKKWRKKNPDRMRARMDRYRSKIRQKAVAILGGVCSRCGLDDLRVLQIDHIYGGGREEQRKIRSFGVCRNVIKGVEGYQILCSNCNWIKRYERGEHQ